ncbi:MAG: tryptophan synthase subunit alpha [Microbacteriaceae bacterium]
MSRVTETIRAAEEAGRGALVAYLPAGFPTVAESVAAVIALAEGGADIIELGIPYSDPVMDGVVIQRATNVALGNGLRVKHVFEIIREVTSRVDVPILVMTYWNPVVQYGIDRFAKDLAEAGGAGLITPDLIPDEAGEWIAASDLHGLDRVFLAAPSSSDERLRATVEASRGFVYAVSTMGITGAREDLDAAARTLVGRLRSVGAETVCVGVGISNAEQVRDVCGYADGAIVGSLLVTALETGGARAVRETTATLATGTNTARL